MAPKFKGKSADAWLDSNEEGPRSKGKAARTKKHARSGFLPAEEANATVAEVFPNLCRARLEADGAEVLCSYKRAELLGVSEGGARERSPVAVGDRVRVERSSPDSGVVTGVCERRNRLVRRAPGRESRSLHHVLAANVDVLAIVASSCNPEFTPGLVDRFLVAASSAGIQAMIVVTKIDLSAESRERPWELYRQLGIEIFETATRGSGRVGDVGIEGLRARLAGRTVVFCGHSGVGKTSLLRALTGRDVGKVQEISDATGKGQHTTTSAVLLWGPEDSRWIDTPGVKEFGLVDTSPERLAEHYPELQAAPCEVTGCRHRGEPGCRASELPRYSSYRRILESLDELSTDGS